MFTHVRRLRYLAIAAAVLASSAVQAQSTTLTAGFSDFRYELVDLDLTDNITPSITFATPDWLPNVWRSSAGASFGGSVPPDTQTLHGVGSLSYSGMFGSAGSVAGPVGLSTTVTMNPGVAANVTINSTAGYFTQFTLTPHTRVVFSWLGELDAPDASNGYDVTSGLHIRGSLLSGSSQSQGFDEYLGQGTDRHFNILHALSTFSSEGTGYLGYDAAVNVYRYAAVPVPEPETYAMLSAGLLMLALRARRRKV